MRANHAVGRRASRRLLLTVAPAGLALLLIGPQFLIGASGPPDGGLVLQTPTTVTTTTTTVPAISPSLSFDLSPGHLVRRHTPINATITTENLDPLSYSNIVFRADITPYEDAETRCNGADTGRDIEIEVDQSTETFTVNIFAACPHKSIGTYTLDLQVFHPEDLVTPLAASTTYFAFSEHLRIGEPTPEHPDDNPPPIWLDPDPADLVVDGLWHPFRIRTDVTQYLPGRVVITPEIFITEEVVTTVTQVVIMVKKSEFDMHDCVNEIEDDMDEDDMDEDDMDDDDDDDDDEEEEDEEVECVIEVVTEEVVTKRESKLRMHPFSLLPKQAPQAFCNLDEPFHFTVTREVNQVIYLTACEAGDTSVALSHNSLGAGALHTHEIEVSARPNNVAPVFTEGAHTIRWVAENVPQGTDIGRKVQATDSDSGATLTYSLGGTDASSFRINSGNGQLRTHASLDYETKKFYSVDVSVSDGKDASGNADTSVDDTISVAVLVINLPPFQVDFFIAQATPGFTILYVRKTEPADEERTVTLRVAPRQGIEDLELEPSSITFGRNRQEAKVYLRGLSSRLIGRSVIVQVLFEGKVVHSDSILVIPTPSRGGGGGGGGGGGEEELELDDVPPPSASEVFTDVPAGSWFESAVNWMLLHDITRGCAATLFCPRAELTRQQFVTLLWRVAGQPAPVSLGSEVFSDVSEGVFSDRAIGWAVANDVTRGCTAGTFGDADWRFCPTQPVTRGQMAALLYRHTGADYVGQNLAYRDVEAGDFFAVAVAWLTDFEVVGGV